MAYYTLFREYKVVETLIVKADSKHEAYMNAGDDIKCVITTEHETDYEPVYDSISEVAYVSSTTRKRIEENS